MKRGRKGDSPETKTAKDGHFRKPERRARSKFKSALSAEERAQVLASLKEGEVPSFMMDQRFDMELKIWTELAPDLRRINALANLDRFGFAMYCVHMADWVAATLDIKKNGPTYKSRNTITKDVLHKLNPMVRVRDIAEKHILDIGGRFGLDPFNRFKLIAAEAFGGGQLPLPFGGQAAEPDPEQPSAAPTGFLKNNASTPLPN